MNDRTPSRPRHRAMAWVGATLLLAAALPLQAQQAYQMPPQAIADILDAPPLPGVGISPDNEWLLFSDRRSMPTIAEMAEPMLRLAGSRINPANNGPAGTPRTVGLRLRPVEGGDEHAIALPAGTVVSGTWWSPDARRIALLTSGDDAIQLWVADAATGQARLVTDAAINATGFGACQWLPDSTRMLCRFVPDGRGAPPPEPRVPAGPVIQESSGRAAPVRTYQDLLQNAYDEALYDYYFTSQLAIVDVTNGERSPVGQPAIFRGVSISPSGEYLIVNRTVRPYSYLVTAGAFPQETEVWDLAGRVVHHVASYPIQELPSGHVTTLPRSLSWQPTSPATLYWVEALDGGDPKADAEHRDRILTLAAPFTREPTELARTEQRYGGLAWGEGGFALLSDYDRARRWRRTWILDEVRPGATPRLLWDLSAEDAYANPGSPEFRRTDAGDAVILRQGDWIYLTGAGASAEGDRPFLDRLNLRTLETERLWQSDADAYETVVALLDNDARTVITRRETATDPANYFLRDLRAGAATALTDFPDPAPQFRDVQKQLVVYERADGVPLNGTLYLPPNYRTGERLPVVMWAYPREFASADAAGQVRGSDNRFTTVGGSSHLFFLLEGYAVFDGPSMPIIGGDTANNTYIEQLVMSAEAAANKLVEMGVADPERMGVGGHSYGAFMTANLLAHSDVFRAGIARSGAYNRTLTPFGFQNEQRTFWEAPDIYARMSPFFHAEKIDEPMLMIHGEADNNSGTFPIQSERMYHALKGHGATTRLVMLPHESHGYAARESVMHTLAEMIGWFDRFVKQAPPRNVTSE